MNAPAGQGQRAVALDRWRKVCENECVEGECEQRMKSMALPTAHTVISSIPRAALNPLCSPSTSDHEGQRGALLRPVGEREGGAG